MTDWTMKYHVFAYFSPWRRTVDLLYVRQESGVRMCAKPVEWEPLPEGGDPNAPTLQIPDYVAQELMDELWRCGLRPTEGTGSAGALAATQRHLDDMRKIAMKKIGIKP